MPHGIVPAGFVPHTASISQALQRKRPRRIEIAHAMLVMDGQRLVRFAGKERRA
jgi:hypothetical protein